MTDTGAVTSSGQGEGGFVAGGRTVAAGNGWRWIASGWELFKQSPAIWIVNVVILAAIIVALGLIPWIGNIAINILDPIFGGGFMLGCAALARREPLTVGHLFAGFRTKVGPLALLGIAWLAGLIAIFLVAGAIAGFGALTAMMSGQIGPQHLAAFALAALVALALVIPLAMALWFAPALVVLHNLGPGAALAQSFSACLRNIVPFLIYGIAAFALGIVASIPFALGWLILGPVLIGSVYTSYRDIFFSS